jgi:hypothetical protein
MTGEAAGNGGVAMAALTSAQQAAFNKIALGLGNVAYSEAACSA